MIKARLLTIASVLTLVSAVPALAQDTSTSPGGGQGPGAGNIGMMMFEKMDSNGDGSVSEDEFLSHAKERFTQMDADNDGRVTREEAKDFHMKKRETMREKKQGFRKHRQGGADEIPSGSGEE